MPNWSSASNTEYIKFRAEYFSKALGKQLNEVSHLVEEDEKYFWLQAKMLNGYPKGQKLETNPYGWTTRKKAFDILKNEVFEFDKRCKGNEELEFTEGRAPWIVVAWKEYEKYKGLIEKQSPLKEKISVYFKEANSNLNYNDPWCAAFVTWCFKQTEYSGIIPGGSTYAFAYTQENSSKAKLRKIKGWVQGQLSEPFVGAVIVFNYSHVAFIVGENKSGTSYIYLGGNQGSKEKNQQKICLGSVNKNDSKIYAIMKPKKYQISEDEKRLPKYDVNVENSVNSTR